MTHLTKTWNLEEGYEKKVKVKHEFNKHMQMIIWEGSGFLYSILWCCKDFGVILRKCCFYCSEKVKNDAIVKSIGSIYYILPKHLLVFILGVLAKRLLHNMKKRITLGAVHGKILDGI